MIYNMMGFHDSASYFYACVIVSFLSLLPPKFQGCLTTSKIHCSFLQPWPSRVCLSNYHHSFFPKLFPYQLICFSNLYSTCKKKNPLIVSHFLNVHSVNTWRAIHFCLKNDLFLMTEQQSVEYSSASWSTDLLNDIRLIHVLGIVNNTAKNLGTKLSI